MKFIYYLRIKKAYVFFILMSLICIASFAVAGRETLIAYKKQNQEIGSPQVAGSKNVEYSKAVMPTLKNLNEMPLYFNGRRVAGLSAYASSKGEVMYSLDDIFNYLGINYTYHYADGIIAADVNDCKVVLKINSDTFTVDGIEKQLPFAVVLANDRIMVPEELLNALPGFSASGKAYLSSAYVDYSSDYLAKGFKGIYYLGATKDTTGIYGINGNRYINVVDNDGKSTYDYSPYRQSVLFKRDDKAYIIAKGMDFIPVLLKLGITCQWTDDYKAIYEASDNFNRLDIYNPDNGKIKTFDNVRDQIASNTEFQDFSAGALRLVSYWSYGTVTRMNVLNTITNKICTVLYKNDKPVVTGNTWLSPTGRYMIYTKGGQYRICAFDGEQDVGLDGAEAARWVTDDTLLVYKSGEWSPCDTSGHSKNYKDNNLVFIGVTGDSSVLFKDSGAIYRSVNGIDEKIVDIGVKIDSAVASPDYYSIVAGSREDNSLYLIYNSVPVKIADYSAMLKSYGTNGLAEDIQRSVKYSPNGKLICAAFLDKNSVVFKLMNADGSGANEIRIDSDAYLRSQYGTTDFKFIDNKKVVFYDQNNIWFINLNKESPEISEFPKAEQNASIRGVMIN